MGSLARCVHEGAFGGRLDVELPGTALTTLGMA